MEVTAKVAGMEERRTASSEAGLHSLNPCSAGGLSERVELR